MSPMAGVEELFDREFPRLVRSLGVAFGADEAADAVQEAFIAADRSWWRVRSSTCVRTLSCDVRDRIG